MNEVRLQLDGLRGQVTALEGEREQVGHTIRQRLVGVRKGVPLARGEPKCAVDARPSAGAAYDARPRIASDRRFTHGLRVGDAVPCDFQLAVGADDVQHHRFSTIETQDVKAFKRDHLAHDGRQARHQFRQRRRLRRKARHEAGGEDVGIVTTQDLNEEVERFKRASGRIAAPKSGNYV